MRNYPGGVGTIDPASGRVVGAEDRWIMTPTFSVPAWRAPYVERFTPSGG